MINVDVSEIKSFRECKRKWGMTSRNMWHMRSKAPSENLIFGTVFHECLAKLYLKKPLEDVITYASNKLGDLTARKKIETMLTGYYDNVLQDDLQIYKVLDIEHHFEIDAYPFNTVGITLVGSIDMICVTVDNVVWGFEHKTCSKFRDELYNSVDEQPRLYTLALQQFVDNLNKTTKPEVPYTVGGVFINEVRKLVRTFDHKRTPCIYKEVDQEAFLQGFFHSCSQLSESVALGTVPSPEPGFMKCQMCDFKNVCDECGYQKLEKDEFLKEYGEEFEVRDHDHLEDKSEVVVE